MADVLTRMGKEIDCLSLQEGLKRDRREHSCAPRDRHFTREVLSTSSVESSTLLRRRDREIADVRANGGAATISFAGGGSIQGPATAEQLFRFVADQRGVFRSRDAHGEMSEDAKLLILTELTRRGLLARVAACAAERASPSATALIP
jgi:hypothetical protein